MIVTDIWIFWVHTTCCREIEGYGKCFDQIYFSNLAIKFTIKFYQAYKCGSSSKREVSLGCKRYDNISDFKRKYNYKLDVV